MSAHLGYYVNSLDESKVKHIHDLAGETTSNFAPISYTANHFYIGKIASYVFIFEANGYFDETNVGIYLNYDNLSKDEIIEELAPIFNDLNYIETLEF